jgi:hypothetical protein
LRPGNSRSRRITRRWWRSFEELPRCGEADAPALEPALEAGLERERSPELEVARQVHELTRETAAALHAHGHLRRLGERGTELEQPAQRVSQLCAAAHGDRRGVTPSELALALGVEQAGALLAQERSPFLVVGGAARTRSK